MGQRRQLWIVSEAKVDGKRSFGFFTIARGVGASREAGSAWCNVEKKQSVVHIFIGACVKHSPVCRCSDSTFTLGEHVMFKIARVGPACSGCSVPRPGLPP